VSSAARIVASLTETPSGDELRLLSEQVDILELRADLVRDVELPWLRERFAGELLFTLRSREQGGASDASDDTRRQRLLAAVGDCDLIDLELTRDLEESLLAEIEPSKRLISWHGSAANLSQLQSHFERMADHPARYYKLVPDSERSPHEMAPLALLHSMRRNDIIAFASGPLGRWTRLVAPRLGAAVIFAAAGRRPAAPGQFSVSELIETYGFPRLGKLEVLYGLVGRRIEHSLSPRIHNNLYRALGIPACYLPFQVEEFGEFWIEIVESGSFPELGFRLGGLSITAPYKGIASAVAGARSPLVDWIDSANTLIYEDEVWEAESTDGEGVVSTLVEAGASIAGSKAAVVGAGGSGRSATVALNRAGATVTLVNRNLDRGLKSAKKLRVDFRALEGFDPTGFDIVVHATSVGSKPGQSLIFDPSRLDEESILVDMIYTEQGPSDLVREARAMGRVAIDGRIPLLHQARPQIRMMTGYEPSIEDLHHWAGLSAS